MPYILWSVLSPVKSLGLSPSLSSWQGVLAYRTKMRDRDPTWHARGDDETLGIHWVLACWKKSKTC